jgi:hypothetical protein
MNELVILFHGNSYRFNVADDHVEEFNKKLSDAVQQVREKKVWQLMSVGKAFFVSDAIIGWYFKPKTTTPEEKHLKMHEEFLDLIKQQSDRGF